jgi:BirA family transcriptional regulator, biotin operon repressor / biotin---[acetyl-CoA-carboxylase] ligase
MQLDPTALAAGVRLIAHETIGSTNTQALALSRRGERGPLWITAACQSAGRGRRGNVWVSEPGNLYASLLLGDGAAMRAGELAFVAALAVHDAVAELAPQLRSHLALKWPNDLLVAGRKFAGVLIEAEGSAIVVGIGVNCAQHPAATPFPATDLAAAGAPVTPQQLFPCLSKTMLVRLSQWGEGGGFAAIRADWLNRATGVGEDIRVRLPARELSGRFQALDESGRLVLRLPDGRIEFISAGEVFATQPGQLSPAR